MVKTTHISPTYICDNCNTEYEFEEKPPFSCINCNVCNKQMVLSKCIKDKQ